MCVAFKPIWKNDVYVQILLNFKSFEKERALAHTVQP